MTTRIQVRRGSTSDWNTSNPVLSTGEIGFNTTLGAIKIGDGVSDWSELDYLPTMADLTPAEVGAIALTEKGAANGVAELDASQNVLTRTGVVFEGATANEFETTLLVTDPTADRTITLPNITGTVITTGDSETVTSTMIADGTIVNGDINASAAIAVSKLAASTISGVTLGNNLNALTIGTGLSGTSYNGSSAVTVDIDSTVATLTGSQSLTNKTLGSGTTLSANLNANSNKITSLATPTASTDAATKQYVDDFAQGLHIHPSVVAATTGNLTATYSNGSSGVGATLTNSSTQAALVIDGVTLSTSDRVLVKNQSTQLQNGIYTVTNTGSVSTNWVLTRATDMDESLEVDGGDFVFVTGGTVGDNTGWVQVETGVTVGVSSIVFTQFSGAGTYLAGNGLTLTGNTFSINTGITADLSTAQTLTNKTINGANNTLTVRLANDITGFGTGVATFLATPSSANLISAITDETGTGSLVFSASPTFTGTPAAPTAAANTNTTQIATTAFVLGQGNSTAATIAALGTQAAGSSNLYARADHVHPTTGVGLTASGLNQFASTTSAQLAGVISDETGSGALVFATSPTLTTPNIGVATGTSFNSITALSSTTPSANGSAAVGTSTTVARADHVHPTTGLGLTASGLNQFASTTSAQLAGVISDETGSGSLVFGTSPTIATPTLTLSTSTSTTEGRIAWDSTNDKIIIGDGSTAREFASSTLVTNAQVGTTYTFVLADKDKLVELNNASAITVSVPTNSVAYPVGTQINILQTGAGQVTIAAGTPATTTINGTPGLKLRAQWSSATLIKRATETWVAIGDLSA